jgi:hypothetical protein
MDLAKATQAAIDELKRQDNWNYINDIDGHNNVILDGTFDIEKIIYVALASQENN